MEKKKLLKRAVIALLLLCSAVSLLLLFLPETQVSAIVKDVKVRPFFYYDSKDYTGQEGDERIRYETFERMLNLSVTTEGSTYESRRSLNDEEVRLGIPSVSKTYFDSSLSIQVRSMMNGDMNAELGVDDKGDGVFLNSDSAKYVTTRANNKYSPERNKQVERGWLVLSHRPKTYDGFGAWQDVFVRGDFFGGYNSEKINFDGDGEYSLQIFIEMRDPGIIWNARTFNIKLEYFFEISRDHVVASVDGSTAFGNGNDVEKDSITNQPFYISKTQTKYYGQNHSVNQTVFFEHYDLSGNHIESGAIYGSDSKYFSSDGYYEFTYNIRNVFFKNFAITKDTSSISSHLVFNNLYKRDSALKINYCEGYFDFGWTLSRHGDYYKAIVKKNGEVIDHKSNGEVKRYSGAGTYSIEIYNVPSRSSEDYTKKETYTIYVSEMNNPISNDNKLNNLDNTMFQRLESKWLQVENTKYSAANSGEIFRHKYVCFPISQSLKANDFALSIGSSVKTVYYTPNLAGDYYFVNDKSINVKAPLTDKLYLYDTFIFGHGQDSVSNGYLESDRGTLRDGDGKIYNLEYNKPVSSFLNIDGEYELTEYDVYGNRNSYKVTRDLTAPIVNLKDGDSYIIAENNAKYVVSDFTVSSFVDAHDSWAVIKINDEYYLQSEIAGKEFKRSGLYNITAYDRNNNVINFTVKVAERAADALLMAHDQEIAATNGGEYDVLCFSVRLNNEILKKYFEFEVNGKFYDYESLRKNFTIFGKYYVRITDKYNGDGISFSVMINPRSVGTTILYNDDDTSDLKCAADIDVKRFKIISDKTYYNLFINGKRYDFNSEYIYANGAYTVVVEDIYTKEIIMAQFEILNLKVDFMFLIDNGKKIAVEDGQMYDAVRFKLLSNNDDYANNIVKLNNEVLGNYSEFFTSFGEYRFELTNKYSLEKVSCSVLIKERIPSVNIVYNFDQKIQSEDNQNYDLRRFYIDNVPYYLDVTVNDKKYTFDEYLTDKGVYDVVVKDVYSKIEQRFSVTINQLVILEGVDNFTITNNAVRALFDSSITRVTLRIDGKIQINYGTQYPVNGYEYFDFSSLQGKTHIYIIAENIFDATDILEIMFIIEKPISSDYAAESQVDDSSQNMFLTGSHSTDQSGSVTVVTVVTISGLIVAFIALLLGRRLNKHIKLRSEITQRSNHK